MEQTPGTAPDAGSAPDVHSKETGYIEHELGEGELDPTSQEKTSIERHGREKLETDILTVAASPDVQDVLQIYAITLASDCHAVRSSSIAAAAESPHELKQQLDRGLKAILSASCDMRLETFHWMVMRFRREGTATEIVDCFFTEAESQRNEAEGDDKEIIEEVFGV